MPTVSSVVHRFEVRSREGAGDPRARETGDRVRALEPGCRDLTVARVYFIEGDLTEDQLDTIERRLLVDRVNETGSRGAGATESGSIIEIHPLPGVMDPAAASVRDAILDLVAEHVEVSTGWRYDLDLDPDAARRVAESLLANPVIHAIHTEPFSPDELPHGRSYEFKLTHVPLRDLDDDALERLSRDAHLFLSLDEMRAIRDEYRALEREPTDIELETLAQTWSEHCVHKTLKANIWYTGPDDDTIDWSNRSGHTVNPDGSVTIDNLLKSTVAAATHELISEGVDWTLSVFVDNAGIIRFDDDHAVCVKVETHNHPSAIEPYGGAATGIGGCIRDIIGTGLAAKPIASTDVFCVAHPGSFSSPVPDGGGAEQSEAEGVKQLPAGCLPPERILTNVVAGVRDYGNRMGIPTVNGAVWFDDRYVGNPLVFCGSIGVMPIDKTHGDARPGDLIVALGGRTGRDGIHGATFSSAELTDTHADEFSHAVQIGNAIEEKRVLDAILRARDCVPSEGSAISDQASGTECRVPNAGCLFSAITDCGAGGFSSAVGEMGERIGATVDLERAPLKYSGLSYTEIWISEAQERMVLAVPKDNLDALKRICDEEHVELAVLGTFGTPERDLVLNYDGAEVGRLPMEFLHDGIPTPTREATWSPKKLNAKSAEARGAGTASKNNVNSDSSLSVSSPRNSASSALNPSVREALLKLLAHPNIASKHWIIRQYDHEVQGRTIVKPLVGPGGRGPGDAAVIEPVPGSGQGLAIACGLATNLGDPELGGDPYHMALAAIDECVRNLVCVGADPERIAILDNFCWPSCAKPENLGALVRAAEGCYDGAKAYRTPFISGKDSLNNQFTTESGRTIEIPPTLLISGVGIVHDVNKCVTMDLKKPGNVLHVVEPWEEPFIQNIFRLGGSHYEREFGLPHDHSPISEHPLQDPAQGLRHARGIAEAIRRGLVASCHDCSDGGALVAVAEMLIGGSSRAESLGVDWHLDGPIERLFAERPGCYVVEVPAERQSEFFDLLKEMRVGCGPFGRVTDTGQLTLGGPEPSDSIPVEDLARAWLGTLDW